MTLSFLPSAPYLLMSRYGLALQERRELMGFRTQSDLARLAKKLHQDGVLPGGLKPFSQQWLSALEDDRTGESIGNARPRMIRALAYLLKWSSDEFREAVGVPIAPVPHFDDEEDSRAPAPALAAHGSDAVISDSLLEAAEMFGAQPEFAALRERRWQVYLEQLHHKRRPQTPAEWLKVFVSLRDHLDPPVTDGPADR